MVNSGVSRLITRDEDEERPETGARSIVSDRLNNPWPLLPSAPSNDVDALLDFGFLVSVFDFALLSFALLINGGGGRLLRCIHAKCCRSNLRIKLRVFPGVVTVCCCWGGGDGGASGGGGGGGVSSSDDESIDDDVMDDLLRWW